MAKRFSESTRLRPKRTSAKNQRGGNTHPGMAPRITLVNANKHISVLHSCDSRDWRSSIFLIACGTMSTLQTISETLGCHDKRDAYLPIMPIETTVDAEDLNSRVRELRRFL